MRIVIPTTGSMGDVQPYVALGVGLRKRGHDVVLATHSDFEPLVTEQGLNFFLMELDGGKELCASDGGDRMIHSGSNPFTFLREFTKMRRPMLRERLRRCWQACRGADVILSTNTEFLLAEAVAERERLPVIWSSLQPVAPSQYRPSCLFPPLPRYVPGKRVYNFATHALTGWSMWLPLREELNRARREVLGLPPLPLYGPASSFLTPRLSLNAYSAHVAPPPPDLSPHHHVTGFWFLNPDVPWTPPESLQKFLSASPRPFCIGFGSMHDREAARMTEMVAEALERTGQRAVLLTGWGGLEDSRVSDRLFPLPSAPHAALFPHMAGVIHHGGAGTTAAGLRAGVPSLLCPFMADQPFWGRRVRELRVGPKPIPHHKLNADNLARAIEKMVSSARMRARAGELGERIRREDGVGRAVELVEQHLRWGTRFVPRTNLWTALLSFWNRPLRRLGPGMAPSRKVA